MKTRIPFEEMHSTITKAFIKAGMSADKAGICARIHTESSRDGVYSHGLNRVERFVEYMHKGWVDPLGEPVLASSLGNMEVYDGNLGPGILNAMHCMDRATELAAAHGMGMVSIGTPHIGCVVEHLDGRLLRRDSSAFAGPTRNPACLHGVGSPVPSATTRSS